MHPEPMPRQTQTGPDARAQPSIDSESITLLIPTDFAFFSQDPLMGEADRPLESRFIVPVQGCEIPILYFTVPLSP